MYYDDEDEGPTPETSHPRFRELANEDFFYDSSDDFSPFGNDDGADTLSALEDWLREGGDDLRRFVAELDDSWDLPRPKNLERASNEALSAWLGRDTMNDRYLASHANVRVAVAFGQLKITGAIDPQVADTGLRALGWKRLLNARARIENPDWPHADEESNRIETMTAVLRAASGLR